MPSGISTRCWTPDKKSTDNASSNAGVVCRFIRGILYRHMGVKSIGSKALRVKGNMAQCVGSSSAALWSKVIYSKPLMASALMAIKPCKWQSAFSYGDFVKVKIVNRVPKIRNRLNKCMDDINSWRQAFRSFDPSTTLRTFRTIYALTSPFDYAHGLHHFIHQWFAGNKIGNILQSGLGYLRKRFIGKKSLVGRDEYVGKAHQPHNSIIFNNLFR